MASKGLNLSHMKKDASESQGNKARVVQKQREKEVQAKAKARLALDEDEVDDDDDDDEDLLADLPEKSKGPGKALFIVCGVIVVVIGIILFLVFAGGDEDEVQYSPPPVTDNTQTPAQQEQSTPVTPDLSGMGTQDFTGDTNMQTSDVLTNPDMFVQDLYGLTTRVDYTVNSISSVADFVSYTKHRGTWGGGLELYWLDVLYKENQYVIQIPFRYYKELDEVGIVPVKMEVLSIASSTPGEFLTVISYMTLDEKTLENILKNQK